jgi:23S rRNA pseudouridine2605 synthase
MRLAKYLAYVGVSSRRGAERLIAEGRVRLGGVVVRDPALDVKEGAPVTVDGASVGAPPPRHVYLLHKPTGVLSTVSDPFSRPTVVELVPTTHRLYPVGRLDYDTSGLLLLTNDGDLAYRLTHPSFEVPRRYLVEVENPPLRRGALQRLREGVLLEDGPTAPARVRQLDPRRFEIELREGRNRQVRRMAAAVGHPVRSLKRTHFGPLSLGRLAPGRYRLLAPAEVERLLAFTEGKKAPSRRR